MSDLIEIRNILRRFASERNWERYHSPKNLAMALAVETGELMEHFQWMTETESRDVPEEKWQQIAEEVADVLIYTIQIADRLDIDLARAARAKIESNALKHPISQRALFD